MGINPETGIYIEGNQCAQCEDPFFDDKTPKYIEANIKGVITCPTMTEFINGSYMLTQTGVGCIWRYTDVDFAIQLSFTLGSSLFQIFGVVFTYFTDLNFVSCRDFFTNQEPAVCSGFQGGHSGTAEIFWGPGIHP